MSIYGNLVSDNVVEAAVLASLQGWLPSYLPEVARQEGNDPVALPKSYELSRDAVTAWTQQGLPAIVVVVGGTLTTRRTGPQYRVTYGAQVGAVVGGPTRRHTRRLAGAYGMAIAAALTQHGDLDGLADGIDWTGTDYDLIDSDRTRTLMAAVVSLAVSVNSVLDVSQGPGGPTPDPTDPATPGLPDWGAVEEVDIDLAIVPIGDTPL